MAAAVHGAGQRIRVQSLVWCAAEGKPMVTYNTRKNKQDVLAERRVEAIPRPSRAPGSKMTKPMASSMEAYQ